VLRRSSLLALALLGCRSAEPAPIASEPPEPAVADDRMPEPEPEPESEPESESEPPTEGGAFEPTSDDGVWGNLEGTPIGEDYGRDGLGQVGTGRGCTDCPPHPNVGLGVLPKQAKARPTPSVTFGPATVKGSLDAEFSRRNIRAHADAVQECWGAAGSGTVDLELSIDVRGKVTDVEARTNDEAIGRCIEKAAAAWKFPARQGSIALTLSIEAADP
jgi:hypothetical protein